MEERGKSFGRNVAEQEEKDRELHCKMGYVRTIAGNRLIPNVVDEAARDNPDRVVYTIPHLTEDGDSFEDITALRFANAVNRACRWIEGVLGKGKNFEAIGYIGPRTFFPLESEYRTCSKLPVAVRQSDLSYHGVGLYQDRL